MGSGPLARSVLAGLVGLSLAGTPVVAFAQAATGKEAGSAGKRWEEEFSLWQKVSSGSDVAQYEGYLKQYPNGTFASMARLRIAELQAAAKEKPAKGVVISAGPGKVDDNGKRTPLEVKAGDKVLFGKYSGTEIKLDGEEHMILREDEILAILEA